MAIESFWIDGFNLFHRWDATRASFADMGDDPGRVQERALRTLARKLGRRGARVRVFLDGGLRRESRQVGEMRVQWAGPGKSADQMMEECVSAAGTNACTIAVVTDDNALARTLILLGAIRLGVDEYLGLVDCKPTTRRTGFVEQKFRSLTSAEIEGWVDYFGGEADDGGGE